ncbi:MAG: hypothetical protein ACLPUO_03810 [Streptosporangiaceae bacterium]|jgi:hypothetical protein
MQLRMKLAAVGGAAALTLVAGVPALASSHAAVSKSVTGPEDAYGIVHGKAAVTGSKIPLKLRGLVTAAGVINLNGSGPKKGKTKSLHSSAGILTVMIAGKPTISQKVNLKACHFSQTEDIALSVVGSKSTGKFAGDTGPAAVQVHFAGFGARYKSGPKKGKCNTSPNAPELTKGAVASFQLDAVLTTP